MEFLPVVCLCLLSCSGTTSAAGNEPVKVVVVEEDSEAILPCSLSDKRNLENGVFDWKKDGQKEVFFYENGVTYNDGRHGQDEQFRGRVSHFQDELKNGVASIKIQNTRLTDSGDYACIFPHFQPRQTFNIRLVVDKILKDRSKENKGAAPKPSIEVQQTPDQAVLLCETHGSPRPTLEWRDGANKTLDAEEPQFTERGGRHYVSLRITVTKTDTYSCVATQKNISHQISAETSLTFQGAAQPIIKVLVATENWWLLQCEAHGTPPLTVEWQNSANNKLQAEEPETSESGGLLYITVRITVTKNDNYRCVATQTNISHQTVATIPVHFQEPVVKVVVKEDSEAILPCSLRDKRNIEDVVFDWKRDDQKEVFLYDAGVIYDYRQDEQFRGRVSHFEDELKNGVASIKIQNTRLTDSGVYTCDFPRFQPRQIFHIRLVVVPVLKDRSKENIPGAAPQPSIEVQHKPDQAVLQCETHGSPPPTLEWRDGANNILDAEEPQTTDRGGRQYVSLRITVTKSDKYSCVATQKNISHQISAETSLSFQ